MSIDLLSIVDYSVELEQEDGIIIYEVDIETSTNEYEVVISSKQGTILASEIDPINNEDDEEDDDYPDDVLDTTTLKAFIINELELDHQLIDEWNIDYEVKNGVQIFHIEIFETHK